jgi:glycosyltransferase involved in cell wall biosynthesis
VIGTLDLGGTQTYLARIAPLLSDLGVEVDVCALEPHGPLRARLEAAGIPIHETAYANPAGSSTLRLIRTVRDIRRMVRRGNFDVVHCYLFWAEVLGVMGARLAGCRRVVISRRAMNPFRHDSTWLQNTLETITNLLAHELIANSPEVLCDVEAVEHFVPRRRTVIPNGVEPSRLQAEPGTHAGLRIISVASLKPMKGQEWLIRAMPAAIKERPGARLTLVGDGPERERLELLARAIGVTDAVEFHGPATDPMPLLAASDLFVLSSVAEGFSNAILEAMAAGLPVIASNAGGNRNAIEDGVGGKLVPSSNPEALAAAIIELSASPGSLRDAGLANLKRVRELFSLDQSARRLAAWYRDGATSDSSLR